MLKSFEKLFDGPIKVTQASFAIDQTPVTWLDVVAFSRSNPAEFVLSDALHGQHGHKVCRIWIKGGQVEISEDDYRLIMSGAPERMIPSQPMPEDEAAELGTLNILESRLAMLIKKADAVASKARQLNYHLKGRKTAVITRRGPEQDIPINPARHFSPQPFAAVNSTRSPAPVNGEVSKLQQELLDQFLANNRQQSLLPQQPRPKATRVSNIDTSAHHHHSFNGTPTHSESQRVSHPPGEEGLEVNHRVLMAARIEKLQRGDTIYPPCDRCRRLKFDCAKHLTACSACTKKHAKCSWKDVNEGEIDYVPPVAGSTPQSSHGGDNGFVAASDSDGSLDQKHVVQAQTENRNAEQNDHQELQAGLSAVDQALLTKMAAAAAVQH